ncbi:PAS domain S-box protein [Algibacter miyuki]|uniref:histidine kinase n=1 Tax=Algibacter miyuki TaxID=1306933 RepID=A0ABV5GZ45_9FLAO|nr:PAS domain S-box protein [Algibacter miyuki]MDN3666970.1 PAS domain S-box protein [Algibacter miyuki]
MNYLKKELYDSLKTNPEIFNFIQNHSLDGMWYWDLENRENEWMNDRFWEILGYSQKEIPKENGAWKKFINEDDLKSAHENYNKHINDPNFPYDLTIRYTHKTGKTIWIRCKGFAIRNEAGTPTRMFGSHAEITELKEKEEFLHRCNQQANIGFWDLSTENKTITWSNTTKSIHGVSEDYKPSLETGIDFYKEGYSRTKISDLVFRALSFSEPFTQELQIVTAQGETRWVKVLGIPDRSRKVNERVYGTIQDINDLKISQIKLEQSEQAFRGNFENSAIGMALLDKNGKWIKTNQTLCDILGYTQEELHQLSFQEITHPEDLDLDLKLLTEIISGERDHYKMDKRYFHKNGQIIFIHLAVSVVRDIDDQVLHFVSQIIDITLLKEQENALKRIISITQDQNERLKNFAHIVSHNLRSHSGGISALLQILKDDEPSFFENEMIQLLETSSINLNETIDHLSEVVQINLSSEENLSVLPLSSIIDKQIESVIPLADKKQVTITSTVNDSARVLGVPAYLESIVLNLITNSIKYSSGKRDSFLHINSEKKGKFTVITFSDNGIGIDLKLHQKKLFGMYKTFHGNEDARGIGLFITKNQIETLGGKIEVTSEVNKGTTFKVYLNHEKN